jgi:dihydrofolate reductase
MSKLRVNGFTVSLDGYGAGPRQSLQHPMGVGGQSMQQWACSTRTFQRMFGNPEGGVSGVDDDFAAAGFVDVGAWILGRNMFGPVRGPWPDEDWKGWWGASPPYLVPVFVLTYHARASFEMEGGTTFHFVTGGIHSALEQARKAAGGKDVCIGGGVSTVRQYLKARLIDELHLALRPMLMGSGEHLWQGLDLHALGYECHKSVAGERATHMFLRKKG